MTHRAIPTSRLRRGFGMTEAVISLTIVSVMLVAALNTVGAAQVSVRKTSGQAQGVLLAQQLMTEIMNQLYEDPNAPVFGIEPTQIGAGRSGYNDVDDYNGWSASPPQQIDGTALADLTGWTRSVAVAYASTADVRIDAITDTGIKRIIVLVERDGLPLATLTALRTRGADVSDVTADFSAPRAR